MHLSPSPFVPSQARNGAGEARDLSMVSQHPLPTRLRPDAGSHSVLTPFQWWLCPVATLAWPPRRMGKGHSNRGQQTCTGQSFMHGWRGTALLAFTTPHRAELFRGGLGDRR